MTRKPARALVLLALATCYHSRAHHREWTPKANTTFVVHVVNERNQPIEGAAVRLRVRSTHSRPGGRGGESDTAPAWTGVDGTAVLLVAGDAIPLYAIARFGLWPAQAVDADTGAAIVLGPARSLPGLVRLGACPGGGIPVEIEPALTDPERLRMLPLDADMVPTAPAVGADGSFTATGLGPGAYRAIVHACGRFVDATFTGRVPRIDLDLPERRVDQAIETSIAVRAASPPATAPCRFPPPTAGRLVAGDFYAMYLDASCRLFVRTSDGLWSIVDPAGSVVSLGRGDYVQLATAGSWSGLSTSRGIIAGKTIVILDVQTGSELSTHVISIATGVVEDLGPLVDRALAPERDDLAYSRSHDFDGSHDDDHPLELRFADGTHRRIAERCNQFAWTSDGKLLYLASAPARPAGVLHVFDPVDSSDRILGNIAIPYKRRKVMWPADGHVVVDDDRALDVVELTTGHRERLTDSDPAAVVLGTDVLYRSAHGVRVRDVQRGIESDVAQVVARWGGTWPGALRTAPGGELVIGGVDVAVAANGRLRLLCEVANVIDVSRGFALCLESSTGQVPRAIAVPLDGSNRGIGLAGDRFRLAPDQPVVYAIRAGGALVALHLDDLHEVEIASSVRQFVPLDGGRVLYAVPEDGIYLGTTR